jgi:ABC-type multidrug transport system fused ATPase/permease subunit
MNGKYYLSEERLKQIEEMRSARGGAWNPRKKIMTLRLVQLAIVAFLVTMFLVNIFVQSWELRVVSAIFLVVLLLMIALQIYYLSRARKRFSRQVSKAQQTLSGAGLMSNIFEQLSKIRSTTSRPEMFRQGGE